MDPNETLSELLDALGQVVDLLEEVNQHAESLKNWTRKEGFPPDATDEQVNDLRRYGRLLGVDDVSTSIPQVAINALIPRIAERTRTALDKMRR